MSQRNHSQARIVEFLIIASLGSFAVFSFTAFIKELRNTDAHTFHLNQGAEEFNHSLIYFTHFADHAVFESQPSDACHVIPCKSAVGFKCYQCLLQQGLVVHVGTSNNFIPLICLSSYNLTLFEQGTRDNLMFSGMNYVVNIYRRPTSFESAETRNSGRIISAWPFRLWPHRTDNEPRKTSLLFTIEGSIN